MGKLVSEIEIKSDRDALYDVMRMRPYTIPAMSPLNIRKCELQSGEWGHVGTVIIWNLIQDGKDRVSRDMFGDIDLGNKSVTLEVMEGDMMAVYKSFKKTVRVDNNLVTWTFEYEKLSESVPDPNALMDFLLNVTKDVDASLRRDDDDDKASL